MITPAASSSTGSTGSTSGLASSSRANLDKNAFLQLLVTQLRNQDPMSPLQPHEFAAQLAQFSTVEQLDQLNQNVTQQIQDAQMAALLGKTTFAASLMGKEVVAVGHQVKVPSEGHGQIRVDIGGTGGHGVLVLSDASGKEIARRDMGSLPPGRQTLDLPPGLPAGEWSYSLQVKGAKDATVPVTTYTSGVVDSVFFRDGGIVLRVGSFEITLDDVAEVGAGSGSAPNATPETPPLSSPPSPVSAARGGSIRPPIHREVHPL